MDTVSFPGGKERPGRDADPSPPSSAVGHKRAELYLYSTYGPYTALYRASVPVQRWPLPLYASLKRAAVLFGHTMLAVYCTMGSVNTSTDILPFPYFLKGPLLTPIIAGIRQSQCMEFVNWKFSACWAGNLTNFNLCTFVRYCRVSPKFLRHTLNWSLKHKLWQFK